MHRNHFFSRLYVRTILCAVLCQGGQDFFYRFAAEAPGDDSASVQTTAEERGKGAEMDPKKATQLQKDQETVSLQLLVNKDPENHLDPFLQSGGSGADPYYAADPQ